MPTLVIAHRGASGLVAHGNTLASFERAIEIGAPMMELDVRRTADGQLVVHHDATVGSLAVARASFAELRRAAGERGYDPPLLADVLDLARGRIALDIEIKEPGFEAPLLDLVRGTLSDGYVFKSFHDRTVAALRRLDPGLHVGLLLGVASASPRVRASELFPAARVERCDATFVSPHHRLVRLGFLRRMQRMGLPVWVWTVNDLRLMARLVTLGVDGLVTDRPDLALPIVRAAHLGGAP